MIKIKLTNGFTMRSNNMALQLCKDHVAGPDSKTPGEVLLKSVGDYTSFSSFFKGYLQHSLLEAVDDNGEDITNFADLMKAVDKVLSEITQIVDMSKPLFKVNVKVSDLDDIDFESETLSQPLQLMDDKSEQSPKIRKRRKQQ